MLVVATPALAQGPVVGALRCWAGDPHSAAWRRATVLKRPGYSRVVRRGYKTARLLDLRVRNAIASGAATPDLGGDASTDAFATAVIAALEAA
jgi:isocitrate/isopropylmalate dehydrogenase